MAKRTLIELVQDILSEMGSDEVNSISDTTEATDVAKVVRLVYKELISEMDLPSKKDIVALDGLADTDKPNYMQIPSTVSKILWIKYDTRLDVADAKRYTDITRFDPLDFLAYVNGRDNTDTTTYQIVQHSVNLPLIIQNNKAPSIWTSFDDDYIIFDSFDESVDTTLQTSKSMAEVYLQDDLALADGTVHNLPENMEPLLYTQALNRCFINSKSQSNPKGERNENRLRVRAQRNKWRQGRINHEGPDWGRH